MPRRLLLFLPLLCLAASGVLFGIPPGWPCQNCRGAYPLIWQGGAVWRDHKTPALGGLSGLAVHPDGDTFLALSDQVHLFSGVLQRAPDTEVLQSVTLTGQEALLNATGSPLTPFNSDAEALASGPDGLLFVGFEGLARIIAYAPEDGQTRRATRLHPWDRFHDLWGNAGIEALAPLPGGGLIAITQTGDSFVWRGAEWQSSFKLPDMGAFSVSGADLGPEGHLWVLERRQSWTGFITRIRRFALDGEDLGTADVMLAGHIGWRENYEGISLWCNAAGRTMVTLVSDDGFSYLQRSVLAEFTVHADLNTSFNQPACSSN